MARINGIAYPIAPEVKIMLEKKRKQVSQKMGVKINQPSFSKMVAPTIKKALDNYNFKPNPGKRGKCMAKKKLKKKGRYRRL